LEDASQIDDGKSGARRACPSMCCQNNITPLPGGKGRLFFWTSRLY
jgi:hypothetical protein